MGVTDSLSRRDMGVTDSLSESVTVLFASRSRLRRWRSFTFSFACSICSALFWYFR